MEVLRDLTDKQDAANSKQPAAAPKERAPTIAAALLQKLT